MHEVWGIMQKTAGNFEENNARSYEYNYLSPNKFLFCVDHDVLFSRMKILNHVHALVKYKTCLMFHMQVQFK